jgi:teichuronic acid biosynthesis glycosyltransferase TuaC
VSRPLNIVSVCRTLPNPDDPSGGIFVLNRLAAMAGQATLRVLQPLPFMPALKPLPAWARAASRELRGLQVTHAPMFYVPGALKFADATWLARSVAQQIAQWHRRQPLDAIDAHFGYPEGAGCLQVARQLGIPLFITIRGFETEYARKAGIAGQMLGAMRAAAGCISVSHSLRELALAHGVRDERIRVIHNAIDATTFQWGAREAARTALELPPAAPLIVSVGHLVSRKRHHVLIEAFAQVKRECPNALLAIIGARSFEPRYPQELTERALACGVADSTRFVGNIAPREVVRWLHAADVFALGTAREGCCNAVLEALAAGAPVVTTPAGDNTHFVRDDVNGFIVPIDDASQFGIGLLRAVRRDWDRRLISRQLLDQVGSWNMVAERVLDFMRERLPQPAAVSVAV